MSDNAKIEWTPLVRLKNGNEARYMGRCPVTNKHRVHDPLSGDFGTTWLLDSFGRARGDLAPCDQDYAGPA